MYYHRSSDKELNNNGASEHINIFLGLLFDTSLLNPVWISRRGKIFLFFFSLCDAYFYYFKKSLVGSGGSYP